MWCSGIFPVKRKICDIVLWLYPDIRCRVEMKLCSSADEMKEAAPVHCEIERQN